MELQRRRRCCLRRGLWMITLLLLILAVSGELETVLTRCCNLGVTWARQQRNCDSYPTPIAGVSIEHQPACKSTVGICCLRHYRVLMCDVGKDIALQDLECVRTSQDGGEFRKDCCEGCKLGLIAGVLGEGCSMTGFALDYPWDEAFADCCQLGRLTAAGVANKGGSGGSVGGSGGTQVEIQTRCEIENPCQQRCHDTPGTPSVLCSCFPGFKLGADSKSCNDIDECLVETHTCNLKTQRCANTLGGYVCLDKYSNTSSATSGNSLPIDDHPPTNHIRGGGRQYGSLQQPSTSRTSTFTPPLRSLSPAGSGSAGGGRCPIGYEYNTDSRTCDDVDECAEGLDICNREREFCLNTVGGYDCQKKTQNQCPAGYKYNVAISSCEDINECAERIDSCDPATQTCVNAVGSFRCVPKQPDCPRGYKYDPLASSCRDVNECLEGIHDCDNTQICINTVGSFQCQSRRPVSQHQCGVGFRFSSESGSCLDLNECQVGNHNCGPSQRCDNTIGSYTCIRTTGCGTGYTLNSQSGQCEDDDECALGIHTCSGGYVCKNTLGSFRCNVRSCPPQHKLDSSTGQCILPVCATGFVPNSYGQCIDINECASNACGPNELCINNPGSFRCESTVVCSDGYEIGEDGTSCVDVDECTLGTHECQGNQNCINRQGGYACRCPPGYTINTNRECEDIDECARYGQICTENGECRNTLGSYICICSPGFKQSDEGKTCIDIDECEQKVCQQKCINTWGSFQCSCEPGYNISVDGRSCIDVDECSLFRGRGNLCIGLCVNEPGSFSCRCPDGYKLAADKRTCQDIDECVQGNVCSGDDVCLNTRGGFRCNKIVCPPNYIRDTEHKNRCKRESLVCQHGDADCLRAPLSFSYNYITFVSNLRIPQSGLIDLFTMRGPLWSTTTVQFSLELMSARAPSGVEATTQEYFRLKRTAFNQAVVSLVRTIKGPQDIELELTMKLYSNGLYGGQAVAKIFVFVTQYEF